MSIAYHRINLNKVIIKLRDFLNKKSNIPIAIVFGSAMRRNIVRDLDIAVYFQRKPDLMEICRLIVELEDFLGIPVDLIPLNEVPPKLLLKIVSQGTAVKIEDRKLLAELIKRGVGEKMDITLKQTRRRRSID